MKRDISNLADHSFDTIVIGGGIHGAAVAWQCASQGLKVALVEKGDFGSVTSANSLKIIHGGFRYLQHLNFKRMRESIFSRRIMSQVSPHNIKALPCVIPNSGYGLRSRLLMRIALYLNDIIAFDRNKGVSEQCKIPTGKVLSINACKELFPLVNWYGKTGGAVWYDGLAVNSERLTLAFVEKAVKMGAIVANYLEIKEINIENGLLQGCEVYDSIEEKVFSIKGKTVVVAAGAHNDRLLGKHLDDKQLQKDWARAVNIVVKKKLLRDTAIGLTGETDFVDTDAIIKKKGRFFFFVPWRGYTLIGTTYTHDQSHPSQVRATQVDIKEILDEVNTIFPQAELSLSDVTKVHTGLVPAYPQKKCENSDVQLLKETEISHCGNNVVKPVGGLFSIKSVKYTTAPVVAINVVKKISEFLEIKLPVKYIVPQKTNSTSMPNKLIDFAGYPTILSRYGSNCEKVLQYLEKDRELLSDNPIIYKKEIDYFVHEEMALNLRDVVFRRSEIATAECPQHDLLIKIAQRMAVHFGWSQERIETEIKMVIDTFSWN